MTSTLFVVVRICRNQFKYNKLKIQKLFFNTLHNFWNLHQILNILKKNMTLVAYVFSKLQNVKGMVRQVSK